MVDNFSRMGKEFDTQIYEAYRTPINNDQKNLH